MPRHPTSRYSRLRTLTIEEYQAERLARILDPLARILDPPVAAAVA